MRVGALARESAFARVVLLIQYTTRMRHIACGLPGFTTFLTLSNKLHDFRKKVTGHTMCVLYDLYLTHFSLQDEFSEILS